MIKFNYILQLIFLGIAVLLLISPFMLLYLQILVGFQQALFSVVFSVWSKTRNKLMLIHLGISAAYLGALYLFKDWLNTMNQMEWVYLMAIPWAIAVFYAFASYKLLQRLA